MQKGSLMPKMMMIDEQTVFNALSPDYFFGRRYQNSLGFIKDHALRMHV
jgi:hypothetical protein